MALRMERDRLHHFYVGRCAFLTHARGFGFTCDAFGDARSARRLHECWVSLPSVGVRWAVSAVSKGSQQRETFETGAYPATRTVQGRHAVANRMAIIQALNFTETLKEIGFPVRYIGGANDIVVPVRREIATLSAHFPSQCDFRSELLVGATHAFIASHPEVTVEHLSRWVREIETGLSDSSRLRGVS